MVAAVSQNPKIIPARAYGSTWGSTRTYRRRRVAAAGLAVTVLATARAALGLLGGDTLPASGPPVPVAEVGVPQATATHVVRPGDTLWSLATRIDPEADPRPLVDTLVAANGGSTLYVGQRIELPLG